MGSPAAAGKDRVDPYVRFIDSSDCPARQIRRKSLFTAPIPSRLEDCLGDSKNKSPVLERLAKPNQTS